MLQTTLAPGRARARAVLAAGLAATVTLGVAASAGAVPASAESEPARLAPVEDRAAVAELAADAIAQTAAATDTVYRLAGPDRYSTAVEISWTFGLGDVDGDGVIGEIVLDGEPYTEAAAPVVYVATGESFPDALSAAAPAAYNGGPLLLTKRGALPAVVLEELLRLQPERIVVVGGTPSVSAEVYQQLAEIQPNIRRDAGKDRYETSRIVSEQGFGGAQVGGAFVVNGRNFPDALAAGAAAGAFGIPVILVNGGATSLDTNTSALLERMGVEYVSITGDGNAVSTGIEQSVVNLPFVTYVERLGGANRYATAQQINAAYFKTAVDDPETEYVPGGVNFAVGTNFPDALAGAASAGYFAEPLYTVPTTCIPAQSLSDIRAMQIDTFWLLGNALGAGVEQLTSC